MKYLIATIALVALVGCDAQASRKVGAYDIGNGITATYDPETGATCYSNEYNSTSLSCVRR